MTTFNVNTQTQLVNEFDFTGDQATKAESNNCTRVFRFRYIAGDVNKLPKYIQEAIAAAGFTAVHLGGTTYKYSVIGLR